MPDQKNPKKRGVGRPRRVSGSASTKRVVVWMTPEELATLDLLRGDRSRSGFVLDELAELRRFRARVAAARAAL